jgi:hypothetical protein
MGTWGGLRVAKDGSLDHLIKPKWKSGKTRTIRVPIALADQLLAIARRLDDGETFELLQDKAPGNSTKEKAIAILTEAITPKKQGGTYDSRYGSTVKAAVEKALEVLNTN